MKKKILMCAMLLISLDASARCFLNSYVSEHQSFRFKETKPAVVEFHYNVVNETDQVMNKKISFTVLASDSNLKWNRTVDKVITLQPGERTKTVAVNESVNVWPTGSILSVHGYVESDGCERMDHIRSFGVGNVPIKSHN